MIEALYVGAAVTQMGPAQDNSLNPELCHPLVTTLNAGHCPALSRCHGLCLSRSRASHC